MAHHKRSCPFWHSVQSLSSFETACCCDFILEVCFSRHCPMQLDKLRPSGPLVKLFGDWRGWSLS